MELKMQSDFAVVAERTSTTQEQLGTCDLRMIQSPTGMELYITATPPAGDSQRQARGMYDRIALTLRNAGAFIVQERLFASADAMVPALVSRAESYGDLDDGVMPTLLATRSGTGQIVGAQVHAVAGIRRPRVLASGDSPVARAFDCAGYHYLVASGLSAPQLDGGAAQTRCALGQAESLLAQAGGSLCDIARTWIWMDDILAWYPQLNQARTAFFTQRGLMDVPGRMPASTGIGVSPAVGRVGIDVFAAWGAQDAVGRFHAAGNQRSAYEYGSAFARAARVKTPGGVTVFCSGTAAIDAKGNTCFLDDVQGQVRMTVQNIGAVLRDMDCCDNDVVHAMAYCATPQVEAHFIAHYSHELPWPCLTMVGDVCRDNLLFEIEVTACPNARKV